MIKKSFFFVFLFFKFGKMMGAGHLSKYGGACFPVNLVKLIGLVVGLW